MILHEAEVVIGKSFGLFFNMIADVAGEPENFSQEGMNLNFYLSFAKNLTASLESPQVWGDQHYVYLLVFEGFLCGFALFFSLLSDATIDVVL